MGDPSKVWFITGCSSGLGRALANETLKSGAKVVVTARKLSAITDFVSEFPDQTLALSVDVTDVQQINIAVEEAKKKFGRIDVLVNNAGAAVFGAVEEVPDKDVRNLFETNFFGVLNMIRAVLPVMRAQQSGSIINISSVGGIVATPCLGIFNASKFAVEGLSEALAQELATLGITVSLVEPGPSRTAFITHSQQFSGIADYDDTRNMITSVLTQYQGNQPGDPNKIAHAIIQLVHNPVPPLHLLMGKFSVERAREKLSSLEETITMWEKMSYETDFS